MERVSDIEDKRWMKKEYNDFVYSRNHDLPTIITNNGEIYWIKKDVHRREKDLPALIYPDGSKYWFNKKGQYYRERDLPVIIWHDGIRKRFTKEQKKNE
jgi:hypothetical protein